MINRLIFSFCDSVNRYFATSWSRLLYLANFDITEGFYDIQHHLLAFKFLESLLIPTAFLESSRNWLSLS